MPPAKLSPGEPDSVPASEAVASTAAVVRAVELFAEQQGRRPRILLGRGADVADDDTAGRLITAFADAGFDVDVTPPGVGPAQLAQHAVDDDVHVIGLVDAADVGAVRTALTGLGGTDILIVVIGNPVPATPSAGPTVHLRLGPHGPTPTAVRSLLARLTELLPGVDDRP